MNMLRSELGARVMYDATGCLGVGATEAAGTLTKQEEGYKPRAPSMYRTRNADVLQLPTWA